MRKTTGQQPTNEALAIVEILSQIGFNIQLISSKKYVLNKLTTLNKEDLEKVREAFKKGEKDVAEFWIQKGDRLIHIRYFAVRDKDGKYLGTVEVTQDITDLKKIEGEKRLLDWEG
jgi:DUF438 domain-containing protein